MKKLLSIVLVFASISLLAQKPLSLKQAVMEQTTVFAPSKIKGLQWIKGTEWYSYVNDLGEDPRIMRVNWKDGTEKELMGLKLMNANFVQQRFVKLEELPDTYWQNKSIMMFVHAHRYIQYDTELQLMEPILEYNRDAENVDFSYSAKKAAFTKGNNLYYATPENELIAITQNEKPGIVSGQAIARSEFGITKGTFWSPYGNYLAFYEKDEVQVTTYPIIDYTYAPANQLKVKYPMAGQASENARIGVFNFKTEELTYLNTDGEADDYLTNVTWSPDEKYVNIAQLNRDQNHLRWNQYDVQSGDLVKTLFEEKDDEYVEPENQLFFLENSRDKNGDYEFLCMSERDGFNHLYHYSTNGKFLGQITKGQFEILEILNYNPETQNVLLSGTDRPVDRVVYEVNLKTKKLKKITQKPGTHRPQVTSSGNYILDTYSSVDTPREISIIDREGKMQKELLVAKNPLRANQVGSTEIFTIPGDDGTDLWCRMIKPNDFDPSKKYPVLVYVYGGPHAQLVTDSWLGGASLWMHYFTERGYIIFTLDNRGSAHRGIEFEQSTFRHLGSYEIIDQISGVNYLKSLPYVDGDKLAVHGWSYGGFMAASLMLRTPGIFKVGVAGGPVVDWRFYEVMYTERYMDSPLENPEGYNLASLLNYAPNLDGDLMIIHGSSDDVVVMQHSMVLLNRFINENKQVDFFTYPGHKHNVTGVDRVHLMKKVLDYVEDKLDTNEVN